MAERNRGLDILRGLSLILVCSYHFYPKNSTYIGVYVFFILSGFLVTENLISKEFKYTDYITKKIKRIYPLLLIVLITTTLFYAYICQGLDVKYRLNAITSFLGVSNIYQVYTNLSYFEFHGAVTPLLHTWFLSIELQFYLIFPLIILFFKKLNLKPKVMSIIFLGVALLSTWYMYFLYSEGMDLSKIYYRTDTRIGTFFLGAFFSAFFYKKELKYIKSFKFLSYLGFLIIWIFMFTLEYDNALNYEGLLLFVSIFISIIVLTTSKIKLISGNTFIGKCLARLGENGYSYYLWQYPIMIFANEYFKWIDIDYSYSILFQIIILFIISYFSSNLFEKNFDFKMITVLALIFIMSIFLIPDSKVIEIEFMKEEITNLENTNSISLDELTEMTKENENLIKENENLKLIIKKFRANKLKELKKSKNTNNKEESKSFSPPNFKYKITFIGDSVMESSKKEIENYFPNSVIDAKSSRQFTQLPSVIDELKEKSMLNDLVFIHLGGNGVYNTISFENTMTKLEGRHVFIMNCVVGRYWEKQVNSFLKKNVDQYDNVKIIDWHSFAKSNKNWFLNDATHLKSIGIDKYSKFILDSINDVYSIEIIKKNNPFLNTIITKFEEYFLDLNIFSF